jgi:hypothetical protein
MNYKIIANEFIFQNFIEWLPELAPDETFYVALFARKKYAPNSGIKADKSQLKRFTSNKEMLFDKIKQLECEIGNYKKGDVIIPQEALALYITPSPRSFEIAAKKSAVELIKLVTEPYNNYNPHQVVLDQIQISCRKKIYYDFDFDNVSPEEIFELIKSKINHNALHWIRTRGGFHLLVKQEDIEEKYRKIWYQAISSIPSCDVRGDNLLPVVGCWQGGYIPHFHGFENTSRDYDITIKSIFD